MIGYDTANSSFWVPDDPDFIVCYGDLHYENERAAHARFPNLVKQGRVIDLTAAGALWKDPFAGTDIEPGNAGPSTAVPYVVGERRAGVMRPVVYADQSDMRQILQHLSNAGIHVGAAGPIRPLRLYVAHPTGHEHLCGPHTCGFPVDADITQFWWSDIQGKGNWRGFPGDLDVNTAREDAFGVPKPVDPWAIFPDHPVFTFKVGSTAMRWSEHNALVHIDGALEHTDRYHNYLKGELRPVAKYLRDRVWRVAKYEPPAFTRPREHAVWNDDRHLGTRWQLINHRIQKIDALR